MYRFPLLVPLFVCILVGTTSHGTSAQPFERTVRDTVAFASGTVTVENGEGSIAVGTWERSAVAYKVRLVSEQSAETVDDARIDVDRFKSTLSLSSDFDDIEPQWSFGPEIFGYGVSYPEVNVQIVVPEEVGVDIESEESTVQVTGLQAALAIDVDEGHVRVKKQNGPLRVESEEGGVSLSEVRGDVNIETDEGPVLVEALRGRLMLETDESRAEVDIDTLEPIEVQTEDGPVTLSLPSGVGFDLRTELGDDASIRGDGVLASLVGQDGAVRGGGPLVHVQSEDATVTLRQK